MVEDGDEPAPIAAWRVHDTGLAVAPPRFRRLPGAVRHHQGDGAPWPAQVTLLVRDGELLVASGEIEVGRWAVADVTARRTTAGPPVSFVLDVPGASQLLAAVPGSALDALLAALA